MGGAIGGITSAVGGIIGGIGTHKAQKAEQKSIDKQMDMQRDSLAQQLALTEDYRAAGEKALPQLQAVAGKPIDREALLKSYYGGTEYAMNSDEARRSQLAASAATGGLGSATTSNALAAIAPSLGMDYLNTMTAQQQDQYNQLMGLVNVGLSGSGAQSAAISTGNSNLIGLQGAKGQNSAARAALPWQVGAYANNAMGQGVASDANTFTSMFGGMMGGI